MRITNSMMARFGLTQLNENRSRLARTQEQAATGMRINRPSDDAIDYQAAGTLKVTIRETASFLRSIDFARPRFRATEGAVDDAIEAITEAKVRALEARNDTNDGAGRDALRIEVEELFDRLIHFGNTQAAGGGFIFSGFSSDVAAFQQTGTFVSGSPPPTVAFTGDTNEVSVEVAQGIEVDVTLDGSRVFQGSVDVFQVLGTLWQGIDQDDDARIDQAIGELDEALAQMTSELARIGANENTANQFEDQMRLREEQLASKLSTVQDADVYQVYSDLTAQETTLQASLTVTSRLLGPSLLEFI